jgi:hypothetical protein
MNLSENSSRSSGHLVDVGFDIIIQHEIFQLQLISEC